MTCSCAVFRSLLGPQSAYRHRADLTDLLKRSYLLNHPLFRSLLGPQSAYRHRGTVTARLLVDTICEIRVLDVCTYIPLEMVFVVFVF